MATIFEDDFNSYNDGDLNEQGDPAWSGDVDYIAENPYVPAGRSHGYIF